MAVFKRALKNRDCDVPFCIYRLNFETEKQQLAAGIACAVEIDTEVPSGRREYYLLTCNRVTSKSPERHFSARQCRKPMVSFRKNGDLDINGKNSFSKQNFHFLTTANGWKPKKSLKAKVYVSGDPADVFYSWIIEAFFRLREIVWIKNIETGGYQLQKVEFLEDHSSLGSPVLWKDPETQRFHVIGVVDKEETFFPRLFVEDDLRNLGKFVIIFICFFKINIWTTI